MAHPQVTLPQLQVHKKNLPIYLIDEVRRNENDLE